LTYEGYEKKTVGGLPLKLDLTNFTKSADDLNTLYGSLPFSLFKNA
jgi:hypothetical protein